MVQIFSFRGFTYPKNKKYKYKISSFLVDIRCGKVGKTMDNSPPSADDIRKIKNTNIY